LDGHRLVQGTLDVRIPDDGLDLSLDARDLDFQIASSGSPCRQSFVANGNLEVDDRNAAQRFSERFDEAVFEVSGAGAVAQLSISGLVSSDCIGEVEFVSDQPLRIDPAAECPLGGALGLSFADDTTHAVRFTATGGLEIDIGADEVVDTSVPSCRDQSLARCR
jgi:hypothetical protein